MQYPKIKILFLINTLTGGGAEKVLVDLVNNLNHYKFDITVQTVVDKGINKKYLSSAIRYKTINRIRNPFLCKIWLYLTSFILPARLVHRFLIDPDYDYEVAFLEGVPTKLIAASPNNLSKKYAWVHTDMSILYGHEKVFKSIYHHKLAYKNFNSVFCISESARNGFESLFGKYEQLDVLYNPIDNKSIIIKSEELLTVPMNYNGIKLITVGRLNEEKGYDRLLYACKKLLEDKLDFNLWILGDGKLYDDLNKYIQINKLENKIFLLGFQDNPYKFIKAADYFVCSSRIEGYSLVVAESVIIGTPVITTDCAGVKEILGDSEFGLIVENSTEGIYSGLKNILTNKEIYEKYKVAVKLRSNHFKLAERIKEIESKFENL